MYVMCFFPQDHTAFSLLRTGAGMQGWEDLCSLSQLETKVTGLVLAWDLDKKPR